jgi:hypothetical protein
MYHPHGSALLFNVRFFDGRNDVLRSGFEGHRNDQTEIVGITEREQRVGALQCSAFVFLWSKEATKVGVGSDPMEEPASASRSIGRRRAPGKNVS